MRHENPRWPKEDDVNKVLETKVGEQANLDLKCRNCHVGSAGPLPKIDGLNNSTIQMGKKNGEWNSFYEWLLDDCGKKPCHMLGFCPYGPLVEFYQLREKPSKFSCKVFGHDCPAFYLAEPLSEDMRAEAKKLNQESTNKK